MGTEEIARDFGHELFDTGKVTRPFGLEPHGTPNHFGLILAVRYGLEPAAWREEVLDLFEVERREQQKAEQCSALYTRFHLEWVVQMVRYGIRAGDGKVVGAAYHWLREALALWELGLAEPTRSGQQHFQAIRLPGTRMGIFTIEEAGMFYEALTTGKPPMVDRDIRQDDLAHRLTCVSMLREMMESGEIPPMKPAATGPPGLRSTMHHERYALGFRAWVPEFVSSAGGPVWAVCYSQVGHKVEMVSWLDYTKKWSQTDSDGNRGAKRWGGRTKKLEHPVPTLPGLGARVATTTVSVKGATPDPPAVELDGKPTGPPDDDNVPDPNAPSAEDIRRCLEVRAWYLRNKRMEERGDSPARCLEIFVNNPTSAGAVELRRFKEELTRPSARGQG